MTSEYGPQEALAFPFVLFAHAAAMWVSAGLPAGVWDQEDQGSAVHLSPLLLTSLQPAF